MREYSKGWLAVGAAVLLLVIAAVAANAQNTRMQRRGAGMGARNGMMMFGPGAFLRGLDLTQQQKDQVKAVFANHKTDIQTAMKENAQARLALRNDLINGAAQDALQADFSKASSAEWDAVLLRSKIWAEIKPILTPDQLSKLQQRQQNMSQRMQSFQNRLDKKTGGR